VTQDAGPDRVVVKMVSEWWRDTVNNDQSHLDNGDTSDLCKTLIKTKQSLFSSYYNVLITIINMLTETVYKL